LSEASAVVVTEGGEEKAVLWSGARRRAVSKEANDLSSVVDTTGPREAPAGQSGPVDGGKAAVGIAEEAVGGWKTNRGENSNDLTLIIDAKGVRVRCAWYVELNEGVSGGGICERGDGKQNAEPHRRSQKPRTYHFLPDRALNHLFFYTTVSF